MNKLGQRLNHYMTATIGDAVGATDACGEHGLEMLQEAVIIDYFISSTAVNILTIYHNYAKLLH